MTAQPSTPLSTVAVTFPLSPASLAKVRAAFSTVHYWPDEEVDPQVLPDVDVFFTRYTGLPKGIEFAQLGRLEVVQLTSAGANLALQHPAHASPEAKEQIAVCSASGIHSLSIPPYIISQIVGLYMNIHSSVVITRTQSRWPTRAELRLRPSQGASDAVFGHAGFHALRGKTAGMLGYGHIGRETARLLQAFGVHIVAANSTGERKVDEGYIIPGTGDEDGSVPSAYYSTSDPASFKEFLARSDILVASLPSTPATKYLLTKEHFDALPEDALFINVGRGDLVKSDVILAALDEPNGLLAAGLDVTDPEPLPAGHALLTHPRVVLTPHISADFDGYFDAATDLLIANIERIRGGGKPMNRVDPVKGY